MLLPRVRDDIAEYKRLNYHLYMVRHLNSTSAVIIRAVFMSVFKSNWFCVTTQLEELEKLAPRFLAIKSKNYGPTKLQEQAFNSSFDQFTGLYVSFIIGFKIDYFHGFGFYNS